MAEGTLSERFAANARDPQQVLVLRPARSVRLGLKKVLEVSWCQPIQGLKREQEDLIVYALGNWKPMQVDQHWGDMFSGANTSDDSRSRVLDTLEHLDDSLWGSIQE